MSRPFPGSSHLKLRRKWHDPVGDETKGAIEVTQDVTDIVEKNKYLYNEHDQRARFGDGMVRVAAIPVSVWWDLHRRGVNRDLHSKKFRDWINDSDQRVFRTRPGRI